jgi:hypothetical protein
MIGSADGSDRVSRNASVRRATARLRQRVGAHLQRQGREPGLRIHVEHAGCAIGEFRHRAGDHGVGHRAGLVVGEATSAECAEGESVGLIEAQVNGVGHGASGCWKHSGTEGIIGLQRSGQEWAIRQGWGGRPVRHEQAHGWWRRWGCWPGISGTTRAGGPPEGWSATLDVAARDPLRPVGQHTIAILLSQPRPACCNHISKGACREAHHEPR